jgi:hypothetical protein
VTIKVGPAGVEALEGVHGPHVEEGDEDGLELEDGMTGDTGVVEEEVLGYMLQVEDEVETGRTGALNEGEDELEDHWPQPASWARARAKAKRPTVGMRDW